MKFTTDSEDGRWLPFEECIQAILEGMRAEGRRRREAAEMEAAEMEAAEREARTRSQEK